MIDYSPFWETLKNSSETTYTLINKHHLSSSTLDKLRNNKPVTPQHSMISAGFWTVAWKILPSTFHQTKISHYNTRRKKIGIPNRISPI